MGLYCRTLCVICTPHLLCTPQGMLSPPEVSHSHHTHFPREGGEGGEGDSRENETYRSSPLFPSSPIVPYTFPTPHTPSYGTFSPHTTLSEPSLPPLYSCAPPRPLPGGGEADSLPNRASYKITCYPALPKPKLHSTTHTSHKTTPTTHLYRANSPSPLTGHTHCTLPTHIHYSPRATTFPPPHAHALTFSRAPELRRGC